MAEDIGQICVAGDVLLKMWRVNVPAGERPLQRHAHMQFEITLVDGGSGTYTTKSGVYPMKTGDIFVYASNEEHCITHVEDGGLQITNIHFEPRYLWGSSADSLSGEHINLCFAHSAAFQNRIPSEHSAPITALFLAISAELTLRQTEYPLMTKALLDRLLILLIRDFGYADSSFSVSRSHLHSIRRAITYIDNHLDEKLTLEEIAGLSGISPTYFSALFRRISNITLWDYIASKRVEKAIHLITEPENSETMLEIALKCGFNNTANFNKAFKKQTGITPTQYRKSGDALLH